MIRFPAKLYICFCMKRPLLLLSCLGLLNPLLFAVDEDYVPGPDAMVKEGVPKGKVTQSTWKSTVFAGTERDLP